MSMKHTIHSLVAVTIVASSSAAATPAHALSPVQPSIEVAVPSPTAAELRVALNTLLQEHIFLATSATGAALGGRQEEFGAATAALDANSVSIAAAVGSVYGAEAEEAFLNLWRRHIGFFVDYTTGVATKDAAKQSRAVKDLMGYAGDFAAFLSSANPHLPKDAVEDLVKQHVVTLKAVVDAQATGDVGRSYPAIRAAAAHVHHIADPLAQAIAKQFPDRFGR